MKRIPVLFTISALLLFATIASADTVTISDSSFANTDWTTVELRDETPNDSFVFSGTQVITGGNPGSYRQVINELNTSTASGITAGHLFLGGGFDPGSSGAIASIDVSFDGIGVQGPAGAMGYALLLEQDGNYFGSGLGQVLNGQGWITLGETGLVESDFLAFGSGTLDLSAGASPITFGFAVSNGTFGSPSTNEGGVDNWSVTIHTTTIPEPSSFALCLCIIATWTAGKRRR